MQNLTGHPIESRFAIHKNGQHDFFSPNQVSNYPQLKVEFISRKLHARRKHGVGVKPDDIARPFQIVVVGFVRDIEVVFGNIGSCPDCKVGKRDDPIADVSGVITLTDLRVVRYMPFS